jgi:hypothetical protein
MDFLGYAIIDEIEVKYAGNHLQTLRGLDLQIQYRKDKDRIDQEAAKELVEGDRTDAERAATAAAGVQLFIDLPLFWTGRAHQFLPISVAAHELTVRIKWSSLSKMVESDDTPTGVTIDAQKLRCWLIHVPSDEQAAVQQQSNIGDGLIYMFTDIERHTEASIAAASTSASLALNNIRSPVTEFVHVYRLNSEVNTAAFGNDLFNYQQVQDYKLTGAGLDVVRTVEHKYALFYIWNVFHSGPVGDYIYPWSFSKNPEDMFNHSGSLNFFGVTNPVLETNFPAAIAAAYVQDFLAFTKNLIQIKGGDIKRVFN